MKSVVQDAVLERVHVVQEIQGHVEAANRRLTKAVQKVNLKIP